MPDECCIVDLVQVRPSQEMSCCTSATGGSDKNIYREAVQPERDRSRSPLFQVLFSLQNAPSSPLNLSNITATEIAMPMPTAKFDLSLHMWETADGLGGSFEYNTDLFDETTLTRMTTHLQKVLEEMVGWPGQALSAFSLVTASESELILKQWNATESEELPDISLHQLVEAQVERTPDATAISYDNHSLTYRELNARANQLAHHLQRLGVGPEVPVGICMKRSIEMIIGVLGILKSGGAYLPLDVSYPLDRIKFMLTDTKARLVITQREVKMHLADTQAALYCIEDEDKTLPSGATGNMKTATKGDQLAYIIYTSGSTGRPKGVQIEHRNAVALLHWALKVFGPDELAGTLMATSMCFDLSVFELFAPLCCGGTVILAENALQLSMLSAAGQITLINTVPSVMAELLRAHSLPASVRVINLAGEPLPQRLVRQLYETTSVAKVYNLYGPTEDTTYSTAALMKRECPPNPPIGRPIAHSQAYILDSALQPTPIGVAGELYLGGAGLARGYLNRADLTREKFIQNPFSQQAGSRLYRTGDLGRYLADETIEYLGRADQQVKLRDFRIELGEIEAVLSQHPAVEAAVVQVRERPGGDTYLLAYVVATAETSERDWRSFLRQRLPEYMIPSRFERLAAVPLTSNGKVDRRGLPEPEQQGASEEYVAPRDELEAQLEQIWEQVLGRQHIGILDNFFTLGGHSLLAVQLLARVRKDLKKDLPLSSFFNAQTVAEMAGLIEDAEHHGIPNQRTWMNSYE